MVVTTDDAGVGDAIEPSPSATSLRGLDEVNLFLAGALSGFGPYVAVFLAEQNWTQQGIGLVLTAAGFAGLLTQLPGGELLDATLGPRGREPWPRSGVSGHRSSGPSRRASPLVADARNQSVEFGNAPMTSHRLGGSRIARDTTERRHPARQAFAA
jgi:hypothetical protein